MNLECIYSFEVVVKHCSWENFWKIVFAILLQKKVVLVCKNRDILSNFFLFFMNIIKPFKWCFPYKFALTKEEIPLLNAPIPIYYAFDSSMGLYKIQTENMECCNELNTYYIKEDFFEKSSEQ